jgi:hypothetical protein
MNTDALESLIQQFIAMVAQKHTQFGSPNPFGDPFLLLGELHWGRQSDGCIFPLLSFLVRSSCSSGFPICDR